MRSNDRRVIWAGPRAAGYAFLSILVLTFIGRAATAQEATSATASTESDKLEEIIVTAQKRQENLQQVPISAQVVSNVQLAQQNFNTLDDLSQTLPAVHIASADGSNELYIRGIGSGENSSFDQSVAMFSDDVYHGRSRMSEATFLDLDRIEVLKGPQSTFFGNNAIAGALNIVTKKPGDTFEAWGRVLYGQYGTYAAEGAVGGPLSDTLGVRVAVTRNGDDRGWIDNISDGEHVPRINNFGGRITFDFHPTENFDATFKVESSDDRIGGTVADTPFQFRECPPPAPITPGFGGLGACANALALHLPIGLDSNEVSGIPGQGTKLSTVEDVLTLNYHIAGQTLTSVTAYYNYHFDQDHDLTSLPLSDLTDDITGVLHEPYHQFSQELRISSPTGGPFEYLAGAYFQTDHVESYGAVNFYVFNGFSFLQPYVPFSASADFQQDEKVYSLFGSLSWNATDQLKFNAGLRGSEVQKNQSGGAGDGYGTQLYGGRLPYPASYWPIVQSVFDPSGAPGSCCNPAEAEGTTGLSRTDRALMPSAGIQYQLDPQAMLYATYSRGFKAGGFNGNALPALAPSDVAFGPEHVNAYELGIKSKWLNETLLLNLDVFRSDYKGLQTTAVVFQPTFNDYVSFVRNAASSVSQGVELEAQWLIARDFRLSTNITYLDSYYTSYTNASPTTLQQFCEGSYVLPYCGVYPNPVPPYQNLSGRPTDFAPKFSGSVTASYTVHLPGNYRFITELSPFFTSGYFLGGDSAATDDPLAYTGGYYRLDARVSLEAPSGHWAVDVIGKNLNDRIILTALQQGIYQGSKEEPRNVAVQFRYRY
jgi:iron complex outermembrane receptor protein